MHTFDKQVEDELELIEMVKNERNEVSSQTGGLKLYYSLKSKMNEKGIKKGRDKFYAFLRHNQLLVRKTKRFHITTNSNHLFFKYANKVQGKVPTRSEQLWVSDITYIKTESGHNYLALVTDAYSKQIMGYKFADHMRASLCTDALKMAVKNRIYPEKELMHHSDRGIQYCTAEYVNYAESKNIILSMTEQYDPYENAVAERINRTLKYEFGLKEVIANSKLAKKMIDRAVKIYNTKRLHLSLNMQTPLHVHSTNCVEYKTYRKDKGPVQNLLL